MGPSFDINVKMSIYVDRWSASIWNEDPHFKISKLYFEIYDLSVGVDMTIKTLLHTQVFSYQKFYIASRP